MAQTTKGAPSHLLEALNGNFYQGGPLQIFSHWTHILPAAALIRFLSILNTQDSIGLFLNVFVPQTIFSGNMSGGACKILLLSYPPCTLPSISLECLSISFFYLIPSLLFSHFLHLPFFICSCFITLHGLLCVSSLFPSLPFFLSDCLSGIIALPQIAVLAGQKYSLHLCHKRQKIGVFRGRVEGAVLSYLA